jgi:RNA polymerase sigma-70 factor (ECF subfamily)
VVDSVFVEGLLAPLDLADQRLLRLRYLEDLTQPQIAQVLGMAEGTVKVRLHRLRRLLRERAGMYA